MEKTKKNIRLKRPVKQTNYMTEARALLKPSVYRTIKFIVRYIYEGNLDLPRMIAENETLKMNIPIEEIKKWYPNRLFDRDLQEAVKWLNNSPVNYETDNGWVITHLIGQGTFDIKKGLEIFINPGALPLYNVKSSEFTILDFSTSMVITKKSSLFFYDKCCMWRNARKFEYTPEALQKALDINYDARRIKQRILLPTQEDLKNLFLEGVSDVCFDLEEIKTRKDRGGKIIKWIFRIRTNNDDDMTEIEGYHQFIKEQICNILPDSWKNIESQIKNMDNDRLFDLYERLKKLKEQDQTKIKDIKSYLFMLLREEFKINPNQAESIAQSKFKETTKKEVLTNLNIQKSLEFEDLSKWHVFLEDIKRKIPSNIYKIYFASGVFNFYSLEGENLTVSVPNLFVREKIEEQHIKELESAIITSFGKVKLFYTIIPNKTL